MNTMTLLRLLALALTGLLHTAAANAIAGEASSQQPTNSVYKTVRGELYDSDYDGDDAKYRLRLEHEMVPAEQDPSGNWGSITNGVLISARFYANQYTNGQAVHAIILLRNVGTNDIWMVSPAWENYPFDLFLSRDGKPLKPLKPRWVEGSADGSVSNGSIRPGEQWRFILRLERFFDLTQPGTYRLRAKRGFAGGIKPSSGTANFVIVPQAQAPTVTNQAK